MSIKEYKEEELQDPKCEANISTDLEEVKEFLNGIGRITQYFAFNDK